MRFGLFGGASAKDKASPDVDTAQSYYDFIEYVIEAEALGYYSTFTAEHHFTGYGQISATLNLLTWLGAKTKTIRLGTCSPVATAIGLNERRRHAGSLIRSG